MKSTFDIDDIIEQDSGFPLSLLIVFNASPGVGETGNNRERTASGAQVGDASAQPSVSCKLEPLPLLSALPANRPGKCQRRQGYI